MVEGKLRSRSKRRVKLRITSGHKIHYVKRTPNQAKCGSCSKALHGIPRIRATQMRGLAKSMKRPERPYGGILCSSCMRSYIKSKVRANV